MNAGPAELLVIDASVATKWHLTDEQHTDKARRILESFSQGRAHLLAPSHIRYEVPSAITSATLGRSPRLSQQQAQEAIEEFLSLEIETFESTDIIIGAYLLTHQHRCSFYDALYLSLARRLGVPLVTADRDFYQTIRHLPNIVWIGDYVPSR